MSPTYSITIAGFGNVGATIALILLNDQQINWNINILEPSKSKKGKIVDFLHSTSLYPLKNVTINSEKNFLLADFVIHTAGGSSKIINNRNEIIEESIKITKDIFSNRKFSKKNVKIIVVTNPVDIITYYTQKFSKINSSNVVGTGTLLDSIRLSYYESKKQKVHPSSVSALVLGEHGNSMVPVFSTTNTFNKELKKSDLDLLATKTKNAAFEIKKTEVATVYGISSCVYKIISQFIFPNPSKILSLSVRVNTYYKTVLNLKKNIYLGLPVRFNTLPSNYKIETINLTKSEINKLRKSAHILQELVNKSFQ